MPETCFDHIFGDNYWLIDTDEAKYYNLIKKIKETNPDDVVIVKERPEEGYIAAKVNPKCIALRAPIKRGKDMDEEQKEALRERMKKARESRGKKEWSEKNEEVKKR